MEITSSHTHITRLDKKIYYTSDIVTVHESLLFFFSIRRKEVKAIGHIDCNVRDGLNTHKQKRTYVLWLL